MSDAFFAQIEQSPEQLVGEDLHFEVRDFLASLTVDHLVEVGWEVVHHHVQVFFVSFIGVERVPDLEHA